MKLARPLSTAAGGVVLTLVAAGTALAVNIGIMSHSSDSGVGTLDTMATTAVTASQPNTKYVTIYVDDPSRGLTAINPSDLSQPVAQPVVAAGVSSGERAETHERYEGADDDD